jgi:sulfatase modifying factor 1
MKIVSGLLLMIAFSFLFISCDGTITDDFPPQIYELQPSTTSVGSDVKIIGSCLPGESDDGYIELDGNPMSPEYVKSWSPDEIIFTVPPGTETCQLRVFREKLKSGFLLLTIVDNSLVPVINNLSQGTIQPDNYLQIYGEKFGDSQGNSYVMFGDIKATDYANWSDTKITVNVPMNAETGDVWVVVNGIESNRKNLNIDKVETLLSFVQIPAGTFQMGKDVDNPWDVAPVHDVTIDFDFYMSTTEITQLQWKKVMGGSNPSKIEYVGDNKPVQQVTWHRAVEFCNRLSDMEGLEKCYTINGEDVSCDFSKNGWRLPTEAEWEYSCRAGNDDIDFGGTGIINDMGWYNGNSGNDIHEVAQKEANAFGLYDMHGNVYEWCWDWYATNYYSESPEVNPTGSDEEIEKVLRGGSFNNNSTLCNSWVRMSANPTLFNYNWGFRVVKKK